MSESEANETRSKRGINLEAVQCPACGERMPAIRLPKDLHQMMWGGWTCPKCECRMDKWGKGRDTEEA